MLKLKSVLKNIKKLVDEIINKIAKVKIIQ